jgi:hypothetical protein
MRVMYVSRRDVLANAAAVAASAALPAAASPSEVKDRLFRDLLRIKYPMAPDPLPDFAEHLPPAQFATLSADALQRLQAAYDELVIDMGLEPGSPAFDLFWIEHSSWICAFDEPPIRRIEPE